MTFLTWLLRSYPAAIITHRAAVTDALVHLLRTAPDVVPIRKELLVAMRNTLTLQQVRECVPSRADCPTEFICVEPCTSSARVFKQSGGGGEILQGYACAPAAITAPPMQ